MLYFSVPVLILTIVIFGMEEYLNKRKHQFSSVLLIILVYLMVAGNYQNADTANYENTYNHNVTQSTFQIFGQWAYNLLINACNLFHFSFMQYRFAFYAIGFFALIMAIRKAGISYYPFFLL